MSSKDLETKLKESQDWARLLVENAIDAIIGMDKKGLITHWNPMASTMFGWKESEVLGRSLAETLVPENMRAAHISGVERRNLSSITEMPNQSIEVQALCKNGAELSVELTISSLKISSKDHYVAILRDITKRKQTEEKLKAINENLEKLVDERTEEVKRSEEIIRQSQKMESVGILVGGIAHEFKNTLAGIVGRLYLAKSSAVNNPEVIRHIDVISTLSDRATKMIQQLLTFARKGPVEMRTFDLVSFTKETFKLHKFSIPESIKVETLFTQYSLPINGDPTQIQQILVNLLNNARDALDGITKPYIVVNIELFETNVPFRSAHPDHQDQQYAHLSVEDNGHGISEKDKALIFDPFFTTKEVGKGTGLGLAMAYGAIQTHHGIIEVDSDPGKGTAIHIYLPLTSEAIAIDEQQQESLPAHGRGECILFVDDEAELRETGREVLKALGYTFLEASNGSEAIETYVANEDSIALTIMDVVMPEMGGVAAASAIKEHNRDAKIVFCTGYDQGDVLDDEDLNEGPVMSKPYSIDTLSRIIREQLSD